jgi:hypothetical protein
MQPSSSRAGMMTERSRRGEFLTEGNKVNEGEGGKEGGGLKPEKLKAWSEEQAPV